MIDNAGRLYVFLTYNAQNEHQFACTVYALDRVVEKVEAPSELPNKLMALHAIPQRIQAVNQCVQRTKTKLYVMKVEMVEGICLDYHQG